MIPPLPSLLRDAVARGILTPEQRDALIRLAEDGGTGPAPAERSRGLTGVNVAYAIGALLVLFAFAWFLVSRWATLGPWGVLAVVAGYAAVLVGTGWQLGRIGFPRAAGLAFMLSVTLAPLVAWSILTLVGEWPPLEPNEITRHYRPWMATRYLVLDLSTILVALLVWRKRRFPALIFPIAVALWWTWFHLSELVELGMDMESYREWIMLGCGLALLAMADMMERWQRRTGVREREGDYAGALWYVGLLGFTFAYVMIWEDSNDWKHLMPFVSAGLIALSLATRRRGFVAVGVLGVFGYLAYLASDVFKTGAAFPLVLATLGVLTILSTVWLQRRFPALAARLSGDSGQLPWSPPMAWLPTVFAFGMALISLADAREEREQREFRERLHILRMHSGSLDAHTRGPTGAQVRRGTGSQTEEPARGRVQTAPDPRR
ncbi:MAG: DUF2157 domain-containing protein [Gemmatimonadaceae bacterium]